MLSDPHAVSQPAYRTASPYQVDVSLMVDWIGSALSVEGAAPSLSTTDARVPKVAYAGSLRCQLCEQQHRESDLPFLLKTAEFVQVPETLSAQRARHEGRAEPDVDLEIGVFLFVWFDRHRQKWMIVGKPDDANDGRSRSPSSGRWLDLD